MRYTIQMINTEVMGAIMEQWQYISTFLEANVKSDEIKNYIKQTFSRDAKRHSPESMIPELNKFGSAGWELVHMEPVPRLGRKEDIQFDPYNWSNTYFCVFKKKIGQPEPAQAQAASETETTVTVPPVQLNPNTMP